MPPLVDRCGSLYSLEGQGKPGPIRGADGRGDQVVNGQEISLQRLVREVRAWARTRLWAQVLIGLLFGVGVGVLLGPDIAWVAPDAGAVIGGWLAIPGRLFLGLISLVLIPLVLVSIVQGITGSGGGATLRRLGGRLLVFVLLTTTAASALGVGIAEVIRPGTLLRDAVATVAPDAPDMAVVPQTAATSSDAVGRRLVERLPDIIIDLLPTSAGAAVMPLSIETAVSKLGVRSGTANLVIPLAATINMAGTALYQSIAILFLAQAASIDLSPGTTVGIVVSVVAASIGAPGTPGVGIVILSNIAAGAGIPATGLPLVLGLDRPLDMARTAVNVTGDLTACVIVDGPASESRDEG